MAFAQGAGVPRLLEELVRVLAAGGDGSSQYASFVQEHALANDVEALNRGGVYFTALRQLATDLRGAHERGDPSAAVRELEHFRAQAAADPLLANSGEQLARALQSSIGGSNGAGQAWSGQPTVQQAAPGAAKGAARGSRLDQLIDEAANAIEDNDWREALDVLDEAVAEDPTAVRTHELLLILLERSPNLANQIRNVLEPIESRLSTAGTNVLLRARQLLMSRDDGVGGGDGTGVWNFNVAAPPRDGPGFGQPLGFGQPSGFGQPPGPGGEGFADRPAAAGSGVDAERVWQEAMELLGEGRITDFVRRLRLIPPGDRHYDVAQSYLEVYDPNDPEMQRVQVELARLIVYRVGTLANLGDRVSLEEVRDRMAAARKLIDEYNVSHPNRSLAHPPRVDYWEEVAIKGLQAWTARARAEWALKAGLAAEARAAFHDFVQLAPAKAGLPDAQELQKQIDRLAFAMEVAQRFQALGVAVELNNIGGNLDTVNTAAQTLVDCVETSIQQAQEDALRTLVGNEPRVTANQVAQLELNRDLLQIGLQLLDFKPRALMLRQMPLNPETIGRDYEPFLSSSDALRQSIWAYASSPHPPLQRFCLGAAELAGNTIEGEVSTLLAAAGRPGLSDRDFTILVDLAYALLQKAAQFEPGGQRLGESPDPTQAQSQSVRDLAQRIRQARRNRSFSHFGTRVLRPVAVVAAMAVVFGGLWVFSPGLQDLWTSRFPPPPTPTPTPIPIPTQRPEPPPRCEYVNGFNVCDDADGAIFKTRWNELRWFFGRPITGRMARMDSQDIIVQYFEGGRLEFHKLDARFPIKYGNLADELMELHDYAPLKTAHGARAAPDQKVGTYFPEANHNVAPEFVDTFLRFTKDLWGYPILEPYEESRDGKQVKVQWFQRGRMEVETGSAGQVRFAPLGTEYVRRVLQMEPQFDAAGN